MLTSFLRCFPNVETLHIVVTFHSLVQLSFANQSPSFLASQLEKDYLFATVLHCLNSSLILQSSKAGEATGRHHAKFWLELDPIKCVKSHINKIIIHEFQGEQSEFAFVKFIAKRARKLQTLVLVLTEGTFASVGELYEVNSQLRALTRWSWAAEGCEVLLVGPKLDCTWNFARASDLSVKNPFW